VATKGQRFGAIDGESLTGFLAMELKKSVCKRNHFGQKEKSQMGDYDRPETMPANSTWYVMTEIPGLNYKDVGNMDVEIGLSTLK